MVQIDGGLRTLFREYLRHGFQWTSIETGATVQGVPDSEFCHDGGIQGWVEMKKTDGWTCPLRPEQVGWLTERAIRGGRCWVVTRRRHEGGPRRGPAVDELWLHHGRWARELRSGGLRAVEPLLMTSDGPSRWDWDRVRAILVDS